MSGREWTVLIALAIVAFVGAGAFFYLVFFQAPAPAPAQTTAGNTQPGSNSSSAQPYQQYPSQTQSGNGSVTTATTTVPSTPTAAMEQSPAAFVTGFYKWYLNGLANNSAFASSNAFLESRSHWLTQRFISACDASDPNDADPIILAQDYSNSWTTAIAASTTMQSAGKNTVLISLGTGAKPYALLINLAPMGSGWLIDSVSRAAAQ